MNFLFGSFNEHSTLLMYDLEKELLSTFDLNRKISLGSRSVTTDNGSLYVIGGKPDVNVLNTVWKYDTI